jgi:acyl-CoA thioesterase-2
MGKALDDLLALLDLERIEVNLFRGVSPQEDRQRVFGGQVLGQALVAATRTVEGRIAHSLHAYFLRGGDARDPILYEVDRSRDGTSFTSRRVVAIQHGRPIFNMAVSFQVVEEGLEHQLPMPKVEGPEDFPTEEERRAEIIDQIPEQYREHFVRERPIEMRAKDPQAFFNPKPMEPKQEVWVRANGSLPDDVALHQCIMAYASDFTLLDTSMMPHGISWSDGRLQSASLDHAMWFHRPFRADEWLLYTMDSPSASGARGFNRGMFFDEAGNLVSSVVQEGLIRVREKK